MKILVSTILLIGVLLSFGHAQQKPQTITVPAVTEPEYSGTAYLLSSGGLVPLKKQEVRLHAKLKALVPV